MLTKTKMVKNTIQKAQVYKLGFKNNLKLTVNEGKVEFAGSKQDKSNFFGDLENMFDNIFWTNYAMHSEDYGRADRYTIEQLEEFEYLIN